MNQEEILALLQQKFPQLAPADLAPLASDLAAQGPDSHQSQALITKLTEEQIKDFVPAEAFKKEEQPPVVIPDGRGGGIDPRDGGDWGRFPEELLPGNSLGFGYSKTNFDVYYLGKKIDASASSFQVLSFGYAKDAFNIYFEGAEVKDASSGTFRVLIDGYAKDAFNAYYRGREIPDCNVRTFECMGKGVARDDENKYFLGQKVVW